MSTDSLASLDLLESHPFAEHFNNSSKDTLIGTFLRTYPSLKPEVITTAPKSKVYTNGEKADYVYILLEGNAKLTGGGLQHVSYSTSAALFPTHYTTSYDLTDLHTYLVETNNIDRYPTQRGISRVLHKFTSCGICPSCQEPPPSTPYTPLQSRSECVLTRCRCNEMSTYLSEVGHNKITKKRSRSTKKSFLRTNNSTTKLSSTPSTTTLGMQITHTKNVPLKGIDGLNSEGKYTGDFDMSTYFDFLDVVWQPLHVSRSTTIQDTDTSDILLEDSPSKASQILERNADSDEGIDRATSVQIGSTNRKIDTQHKGIGSTDT